jgi:hypothetical protein
MQIRRVVVTPWRSGTLRLLVYVKVKIRVVDVGRFVREFEWK